MPRLRVVVRPVSMQRCDVFVPSLAFCSPQLRGFTVSGSPFDAFNLPNESIPQAGRKVCPFTVVCWEAASAGAWKPIARRRRNLAGLRRLACDCMAASPKLPRLFLSAGLENVLRMSPTRSLLHLQDGVPDR